MPLYSLRLDDLQGEVLESLQEEFALEWSGEERRGALFLDTFDWRLFKRNLSLELTRRGRGYSALAREKHGEAQEFRVARLPALPQDLPSGPGAERIRKAMGVRRLLPRARVQRTDRTAAVLNEDAKTVVRVRLTSGQVAPGDSRAFLPLPTTLEILPLKGYEREAQALRSFLWKTFGIRAGRRSLLSMAMEVVGETPGRDPSDPTFRLRPDMAASEGARVIHRTLLSVMELNEDGLIRDLDPEFLHDFRVAIRRSRTALGQLKGVFPGAETDHFGNELKWLGSRTGPTRDMDVYLLKIPSYQNALPGGVKDELQPLLRFLEGKKRVAHRSLVRSLDTKRYRTFKKEWSAFLNEDGKPGDPPPNAEKPLLSVASARLWKLYDKVLKGGAEAGEDTPADVLHRLRILCKRLRYVFSFFQDFYPEVEEKPLLKALKGLQDNLGDFNDLHVQQLALRRFADEMLEKGVGPPETLMAMGRLMGQLEAQEEIERRAFGNRFREFARPANVQRFKRLFKPD